VWRAPSISQGGVWTYAAAPATVKNSRPVIDVMFHRKCRPLPSSFIHSFIQSPFNHALFVLTFVLFKPWMFNESRRGSSATYIPSKLKRHWLPLFQHVGAALLGVCARHTSSACVRTTLARAPPDATLSPAHTTSARSAGSVRASSPHARFGLGLHEWTVPVPNPTLGS
jgi:hypothetical protein